MAKYVGKRGDTLIEVMLAVGIFSMVAVAVVAVMSGGTSSSQSALETTLAREEIDTQAEALRFIHRSYIADKNVESKSPYGKLWESITNKAVNSGGFGVGSDVAQFHPETCKSLYEGGGEAIRRGFIINPQDLYRIEALYKLNPNNVNQVLLGSDKLKEASTYPHLIYNSNENNTALLDHTTDAVGASSLWRAEGIYVVAVKDPNSTKLTDGSVSGDSAYYDFYIRTCWYGTGDQSPSTISTVIRLYNPDITQ